jgi:4-hydroxythreonine-4-phosphate dehydrogenase
VIAPLLITPGDPRGIGPEVTFRALAVRCTEGGMPPVVVIGDAAAAASAARSAGVQTVLVGSVSAVPGAVAVYEPPHEEPVEIASIRTAVAAIRAGRGAALVTGPIHKARLAARGFHHAGHTEFLGELCGVAEPVMAFVGGRLAVSLVTVHLPLRAVPAAITRERVLHVVRTSHRALIDQVGHLDPRLLVCGLNPHAGDGGLLGDEEQTVIGPAVQAARAEGIDAVGPVSAEAAFRKAWSGEADLVVAMYHDQALAPLKLVDFGRSVNWTLGLPIVRTSVDHGTADELVGTGRADASSMDAAIRWAEQLATGSAQGPSAAPRRSST